MTPTQEALHDQLLEKTRAGKLVWSDVPDQPNRYVVTVGHFTFRVDDFGSVSVDDVSSDLPPVTFRTLATDGSRISDAIRVFRRDVEAVLQDAIDTVAAAR